MGPVMGEDPVRIRAPPVEAAGGAPGMLARVAGRGFEHPAYEALVML